MDKNFGIGFFMFDRLFGTLAYETSPFNHRGYAAAQERFRNLYDNKAARVRQRHHRGPTTRRDLASPNSDRHTFGTKKES